jgi:hypothetical protein
MAKRRERRTSADKVGQAVFYAGFLAGVASAGLLLRLEMKDMQRSLFDQLAEDSGITLSMIAAFLVPLGIGWLLRSVISGRRWS